ncbi:ParB/RepB/Spo0J family partition protein [Alcaligenes faecalis]|uniref:ParB/RepB/Spo0J family partition protein n=1 Tax=Alcaligenes TaxID=507 RepID=UPI000A2D5BC1|nr:MULTISPECIES: ParB/RepB/Spo0J family partition protein [Alcaligenes]MBH0310134.1 ParB/RepB/Spo0J family partition protein [Alcaligenes faecalis]MCM2559044.1 ParB/RepB/Spo0J family partition protein [Alcaligenes faecalis]MCM2623280.1 ParB/RepB/Spo0J family partition protein [Alcaligenes faecalis]MCX5473057.1 ParB/RepB/Spo0J family partition protein [Alcaligenes nematophilus]OSZ35347.1 chromosome partitioning protein ParB [Alcaligenes faecalis]
MKHKAIQLDPRKLIVSEQYQARKTASQTPLPQLADSIAAIGLLHALAVVKSKKRGFHEVIAGGRRLEAIHLLLDDGRWPEGQSVAGNLYEEENALLVSITENVQREQMHPADEFESFAELIDQGKTIEDVAAAFGVTATVVRRRLQLGRVAPILMQAYRDNEVSLDALMAYAMTDNQERQVQVYSNLDMWDRKNPRVIRSMIEEAMTANHRLVHFIGLDTYQAAGGGVTRDLFAEESDLNGIYLTDRALVDQLALGKLQETADSLMAQGWAWADVTLDTEPFSSRYGRVYPEPVELTPEQQATVAQLKTQEKSLMHEIAILEEEEEKADEGEWRALNQQLDELQEQIRAIEDQCEAYTDSQKKVAGCIVRLDYQGVLDVVEGLIRPEDRAQAQEQQQEADGVGRVSLPAVKTRPTHSERLVRQLTANKTAIVQAALANNPNVALAVLVAQLARRHFGAGYYSHGGFGLGISTSCEPLASDAPDFTESRAGQELARIEQHWGDVITPGSDGGELAWALNQDTETLLELLAYLVATTVQGIQHQESSKANALDQLAGLLNIQMPEWWSATSETYLSHVSKDRLVEAVSEGASPEQAAPLVRMKKKEAIDAAEKALAGTNWLPSIMAIKQN